MSTYLDLVNKVIEESGSELDQLTLLNWSSAEAGRKLYPRIKRLVAEAWKLMQMERNEWEFKQAQITTLVYPRIKFQDGDRAAGPPPVGSVFVGQTSGFQFTLRQILDATGDWTLGTAAGQLEFELFEGNQLVMGEVFEELTPIPNDGVFTYLEKGNYDFTTVDPELREIAWTTMVAYSPGSTPVPVVYMPWMNWTYQEASFTQGSITPPAYYSQDPFGRVVFYPQTLNTFNVTFYYTKGPQILTAPTDIPVKLQEEYHDWIAWNALANLAKYDKNADLYAYASNMAAQYKYRAERNLMPLISWGASKFNNTEVE